PRFIAAFESIGIEVITPLRWLARIGELAPYWWPVWPILLAALGIIWWRSGTAASFQTSSWSTLRVFPWMRSLLSDYESATFSELLALLLDHQVAYPRAIVLAADATGNPQLISGAHQFAAAIERGEAPGDALREVPRGAFRPLLRWALSAGQEQ